MKRGGLIFIFIICILTFYAEVPTRYFIGINEVSDKVFNDIPDSLKGFSAEFDYDSVKIKAMQPPFTHYIDSITTPGTILIKERSKEEIDLMLNRLKSIKNENTVLRLHVGDSVPLFRLVDFRNSEIESDFPQKGQCYLLSFWATWCGNCLEELKSEYIPHVAEEFSQHSNFNFIPVCIDASATELQDFFGGRVGSKWAYLADVTYLDTDRQANKIFANAGNIPLNIVIGADGTVKYIHLGKATEKEDLDKLRQAITKGIETSYH